MYDPKIVAAAFQRLFRTYPSFQTGEAEEALRVYFDAVSPYETRDIETAVMNFITGSAPGHNPAFAPSAPMLGSETRRVMTLRVTAEDRDRRLRPSLPPPDIERTPESQQRVRDMMNKTVASLRGMSEAESEEATARHKALWDRTNATFDDERGYSVGDPEGHADAA